MKRFAFLLVCLLFSTTLIGMARAEDDEVPATGEEANNPTGDETNNQANDTANNPGEEAANDPDAQPGADSVNATNNATTPENNPPATESDSAEAEDGAATAAPENPTEAPKDTTTPNGSAGAVLPSLLVVVATAFAGYNFAS